MKQENRYVWSRSWRSKHWYFKPQTQLCCRVHFDLMRNKVWQYQHLNQWFPTWVTFAYLKGYISGWWEKRKMYCILFISKYLYIYQWILFSKMCLLLNVLTLRHKNGVYLYSSKNLIKIKWIYIVLLSLFVIRNFRSTCSSVEMLKRYMVRKGWKPLI